MPQALGSDFTHTRLLGDGRPQKQISEAGAQGTASLRRQSRAFLRIRGGLRAGTEGRGRGGFALGGALQ